MSALLPFLTCTSRVPLKIILFVRSGKDDNGPVPSLTSSASCQAGARMRIGRHKTIKVGGPALVFTLSRRGERGEDSKGVKG